MAQGESTPDTKTTELTVPRDVSGLDRDEAARLIAELSARVARANDEYHRQDAPTISDAAYDRMKLDLARLESRFPDLALQDSPTQRSVQHPPKAFQRSRMPNG